MNSTKTASPADLAAQHIAGQAIDKKMPEDKARLAIAGIIEAEGVAREVAREQSGVNGLVRTELVSMLSDMIIGKTTGTLGFSQSLDLERLREGASATGWARQLLRSAVRSKMRDLRDVHFRDPSVSPLYDRDVDRATVAEAAYFAAVSPAVEEELDDRHYTAALQEVPDMDRLRAAALNKNTALQLRKAFNICAPIVVPTDVLDRTFLIRGMQKDKLAAYTALVAWLAIADPGSHRPISVDDRWLFLYDEFTVEEGEHLASKSPAVAHAIALAALEFSPKPSRDVIREAVRLVALAAPGHDWEKHGRALLQSWVARECSPFSEFNTKSRELTGREIVLAGKESEAEVDSWMQEHGGDLDPDDVFAAWHYGRENIVTEAKMLMDRDFTARSFPELLRQTVVWHRMPLGSSEDAVLASISRIFSTVDPINFPALGPEK